MFFVTRYISGMNACLSATGVWAHTEKSRMDFRYNEYCMPRKAGSVCCKTNPLATSLGVDDRERPNELPETCIKV